MKKSEIILSVLPIVIALLVSCNQPSQKDENQSEEQTKEENTFINLFNGTDLTGWEQKNGTALYEVVDNMIVGSTVKGSPNSFLCTVDDYSDFILEFEVKVDTNLNSGVQIRSHSTPEYENGRVHGYQIEIDPSPRAYSGGIYDEARRGWLKNLEDNEEGRNAFRNGEWNHYRIEARGYSLKSWVNDVPTAELIDSMDSSGFIGLQVHSAPDEGLKVKWRNIRIKILSQDKD